LEQLKAYNSLTILAHNHILSNNWFPRLACVGCVSWLIW